MPFLSIQLWTISRKLEDPVATAISKFSISLMWSTQTLSSHRLSRKTKRPITWNAQHMSMRFLVSLFPHISSIALHKIIANKTIPQNYITSYIGVKFICRENKISFKTAKYGPVLFYLSPMQVPSILPQLMSETHSLVHNEASKTIPKKLSLPKLLFLGESWNGKANTTSASQGTQHISGKWLEQWTSLHSQLCSKKRKCLGLSKIHCPASREGTIQGKAGSRSGVRKPKFIKIKRFFSGRRFQETTLTTLDGIRILMSCGKSGCSVAFK